MAVGGSPSRGEAPEVGENGESSVNQFELGAEAGGGRCWEDPSGNGTGSWLGVRRGIHEVGRRVGSCGREMREYAKQMQIGLGSRSGLPDGVEGSGLGLAKAACAVMFTLRRCHQSLRISLLQKHCIEWDL